jgi:cytochrome P450
MKYDDVCRALRDHDTFSSQHPQAGNTLPRLVLVQDDPPRHTRFRRLVNRVFTLKHIAVLEPWMTRVAHELLDEVGTGEVDVVQSDAVPLPVKVIARLLGIPGEDYLTFKRWSDAAFAAISMTAEERQQHMQEMMAYFITRPFRPVRPRQLNHVVMDERPGLRQQRAPAVWRLPTPHMAPSPFGLA